MLIGLLLSVNNGSVREYNVILCLRACIFAPRSSLGTSSAKPNRAGILRDCSFERREKIANY